MEVTSPLSVTSKIIFNPLKDDSNISALKTFEEVIQTCIGPCGKLKIVQNASGGHVTATSSSQRLLNIVSIKNTFLKLIVSSTKVHLCSFNDGGLTCIFLTLKLINNSLSSIYPLPLIGKLIEHFGKLFIGYLSVENNSSVMKMNLSGIASIQSIVRTILRSKPGCIFNDDGIKHLSILLMKIYLNAIPTTSTMLYYKNINFVTLEGTRSKESRLFEGLLIKLPQIPVKNLSYLKNKSNIKIVLFTTSLSGDAEFPVDKIEHTNNVCIWETVLNFLRNIVEKVIKSNVHILACQKVVHPSLRKQLEDANILVLDRLGYEVAKNFEYLSGASNSSLFTELEFGSITCISKETIGKNEFLLFTNITKPFWTMLICNFNEQAVSETKVVCQQVIDTLFRLLKKPVVCYGAGCTEITTCKLVRKKVYETLEEIKSEIGCTDSQVLETLKIFLQSITDFSVAIHHGSKLNFLTETVHNHLWKLRDDSFPAKSDKCLCGQFAAEPINDSSWCFLTDSPSDLILDSNAYPKETVSPNKDMNQSVILDDLNSKINACSMAFETASLLMRTSVCISS